jgi:hypothetical protein
MDITETTIPDVTQDNIIQSKKILIDSIIKNVYPLFDEVYSEKLDIVRVLKAQIKSKKNELKVQKESIEHLIVEYKRKQKTTKLLDRLDRLVDSGLTYDGTLKHETIILLKIVDKLPSEKLDQQLSKTIQMIQKRFSRE